MDSQAGRRCCTLCWYRRLNPADTRWRNLLFGMNAPPGNWRQRDHVDSLRGRVYGRVTAHQEGSQANLQSWPAQRLHKIALSRLELKGFGARECVHRELASPTRNLSSPGNLLHVTNPLRKEPIFVLIRWTHCNRNNNFKCCQYSTLIRVLPEEPTFYSDSHSVQNP